MFDINVTSLVKAVVEGEIDPMDFSASQMELGPLAGQITWRNCKEYVEDQLLANAGLFLVEQDQLGDVEDWILAFGAWNQDEVDAMSNTELVALLFQFIMGDIRIADGHYDAFGAGLASYREAEREGTAGTRLAPYAYCGACEGFKELDALAIENGDIKYACHTCGGMYDSIDWFFYVGS